MLGARGVIRPSAIALLALLAGTAVGCSDSDSDNDSDSDGGGDGGEPDCTQTLAEYCGDQGCNSMSTLDVSLEDLLNPRRFPTYGRVATLAECDGQVVIEQSTGLGGERYAYDAESGELIGIDNVYSDVPQECDGKRQIGAPIADCDSCPLVGLQSEHDLDVAPCTGERAQPFIDACVQNPPAIIADCAACACEHCYPAFIPDCDPDPAKQENVCHAIGARCVLDHCADCAMLQAAAAAAPPER
jgi:hypothetical protein